MSTSLSLFRLEVGVTHAEAMRHSSSDPFYAEWVQIFSALMSHLPCRLQNKDCLIDWESRMTCVPHPTRPIEEPDPLPPWLSAKQQLATSSTRHTLPTRHGLISRPDAVRNCFRRHRGMRVSYQSYCLRPRLIKSIVATFEAFVQPRNFGCIRG